MIVSVLTYQSEKITYRFGIRSMQEDCVGKTSLAKARVSQDRSREPAGSLHLLARKTFNGGRVHMTPQLLVEVPFDSPLLYWY